MAWKKFTGDGAAQQICSSGNSKLTAEDIETGALTVLVSSGSFGGWMR